MRSILPLIASLQMCVLSSPLPSQESSTRPRRETFNWPNSQVSSTVFRCSMLYVNPTFLPLPSPSVLFILVSPSFPPFFFRNFHSVFFRGLKSQRERKGTGRKGKGRRPGPSWTPRIVFSLYRGMRGEGEGRIKRKGPVRDRL